MDLKDSNWMDVVDSANWWIGVFTHHDGITGVSRRFVANDYLDNGEA
jgi:hypothetical protein